jgi:hypothetical protein
MVNRSFTISIKRLGNGNKAPTRRIPALAPSRDRFGLDSFRRDIDSARRRFIAA